MKEIVERISMPASRRAGRPPPIAPTISSPIASHKGLPIESHIIPVFPKYRGAVLLLVLGAVAILSILAIELSHRANLDVSQASRIRRDAAFRRAFDSGLEIAKGLLIEGRSTLGFNYWGEPWNRVISTQLDSDIKLSVRMADESGKLNILNAMGTGEGVGKARKSLARLFEHLRKAEPDRAKAWEEIEAAVYKRIGVNEEKVPPLYTLDGLREENVPREFVFGNGGIESLALCDYLTTFGSGRININTVSKPVMYSLDEEFDQSLADEIDQWRGGVNEGVSDKYRPFRKEKDLEQVEGIVLRENINGQTRVIKNLFLKIQDRLSVKSTSYSAHLQAHVAGHTREAWGYFELSDVPNAGKELLKLTAYEEIEP